MHKKRKKLIIISLIIIALIIGMVLLCKSNELYIREDKIDNEEIEHVALVYRNLNYKLDYIYIMDEDGSVYYENFLQNYNGHAESEEDLKSMILDVYNNKEKKKYKFDGFTDSLKNQLDETNYNWAIFKKGGVKMDGGEQTYYALVQIGENYELIKLKQSGNCGEFPWSLDYKDICDYMDDVRDKIYNQDVEDDKE